MTRLRARFLIPLLAPALSGCGALLSAGTEAGAGAAGAGIATAATSNAAVAAGIGLGVSAGARAGLQYAQRSLHRDMQDSVAAAAGPLDPGAVARWSVSHAIPIESDERGEVTVSRAFGNGVFSCKDIVFSVEDAVRDAAPRRRFFTAAVCRDGDAWRWASAEPATARWGSLQ